MDPQYTWVLLWRVSWVRYLGVISSFCALIVSCNTKTPGQASSVQSTSSAPPSSIPQPTPTKKTLGPLPFPLIDSHVHLVPLEEPMSFALEVFKRVGVEKFAVKSAGIVGEPRFVATKQLAEHLGEKMAFFANVDWRGIDDKQWGKRAAQQLKDAMAQGATGIKIFKDLGLGVRLKDGTLLKIDDARLEPLWNAAAETNAIVAWHVADPVAFFKPIDKNNERYDELSLAPDWSFYGGDFPSHAELFAAYERVIKRHPKTIFLGIHFGNFPENVVEVARQLEAYPNLYIDVSARLPEIGRQPVETLRAIFITFQDRILFGTDFIVSSQGLQLGSVSTKIPTLNDVLKFYEDHRRFFETNERQIDHPTPIQGNWKINAIGLPREVLKKIYYDNADRLIFSRRRAWLERD